MNTSPSSARWLVRAGLVTLLSLGGAALVAALAAWRPQPLLPAGPRLADVAAAALLAGSGAAAALYHRRAAAAEEARRRAWEALASAADGYLAIDGRQRIAFASAGAASLFGYEPGQLLGLPITDVLPHQSGGRPESVGGTAGDGAADEPRRDLAGRHKDGGELVLHGRTGPDLPAEDGRPVTPIFLQDATRSRKTSEMLRAREAHLRLVVEQMPTVLWTTDVQLRITSTLGAGLAALNVRPEEIIGIGMQEALGAEDVESTPIAAHLKAVHGESLNYEMEWKGRTFQVRVEPLRGPRQRVIGTMGILWDVTERKQALAELKVRERQQATVAALGLQALAGSGLDALMHSAAQDVSRTLGAEFCQILQLCPERKTLRRSAGTQRIQGRGSIGPSGLGESQEAFTLRTGEPVIVDDLRCETRFGPSRGSLDPAAVSGISVVIRGGHGPLGVMTAHTARRRAFGRDDVHFLQAVANVIAVGIERRRAEESQERLVAILEATPDFVAIAGKDQRLSYLNRAGRDMLGLAAGDRLSGCTMADLAPEGAPRAAHAERVQTATARGVWKGEATLVSRAGKKIPVSQVLLSHRSPDGSVEFFSTVARDLTEYLILEEQFRQAQKMEAIGKLAGGVAHDFNNLLCIITGFAEFLLQHLPPAGPQREYAGEILKAGERAAALTRQLLAFSRKQILAPRLINVNALVADTEKMLRRLIGEHIELVTRLDPHLPPIQADPGQIEQALVNLVVNARDAMPQGGQLTLSTSAVSLDADHLRGRSEVRPGRYALLTVSDTGCGMSPEVLNRAFEPFFTTKPVGKGTGLGLATVYGIVKQSGGHVEVESEPDRGTTFKIYLPPTEVAAAPSDPSPPPAPRGMETILLVEDEEGVRSFTRLALQQQGYKVLEACNGEEALAVADGHPARIDLLLTDAVMPKLSGGPLAKEIRARRPETRVLFMSGFTDSNLVRSGIATGEVECLLKPFSANDLAQMVRQVLDDDPAHPAPALSPPGPAVRPEKRILVRGNPGAAVRVECRRDGLGRGPNLAESLVDLSVDGAGLVLQSALEVGDAVALSLTAIASPDGPIPQTGQVVWSRPEADGRHRVGIQFDRRLKFDELRQLTDCGVPAE